MTGNPLVWAHRGASGYAPMNTLPAFEKAVALGADGVELDVQWSKDRQLVVMHDFTVDATTDGSGSVASMPLAALRELDAGSWYSTAFAGVHVPTLDDVFEAVGQQVQINVEIKSVSPFPDGIAQAVAQRIAHHNLSETVLVSSFNPMALRRFKRHAPHVKIGRLFAPNMPPMGHWLAVGLAREAEHPHESLVYEAFVRREHARGRKINAWTVNDMTRAHALAELGADGIITDYPDRVRDALDA